MTFRVHALLIAEIVAALRIVSGSVGSRRSSETSDQQARARAHRGARAAVDRRTNGSTQNRAYHSAARRAVLSGPTGRYSGHLLISKLPARAIVEAKLVEGFGGPRQDEDAGARRHRGARGEPQQCSEQQRLRRTRHNGHGTVHDGGGGWGTTRCQGPAHLSTYG